MYLFIRSFEKLLVLNVKNIDYIFLTAGIQMDSNQFVFLFSYTTLIEYRVIYTVAHYLSRRRNTTVDHELYTSRVRNALLRSML